jgi:hypothetical protein
MTARLTDDLVRRALLDTAVHKRKPALYRVGVLVDAADLYAALERHGGTRVDPRDVDDYFRANGARRLRGPRFAALMRSLGRSGVRSQYFLPMVTYQAIRQRRT